MPDSLFAAYEARGVDRSDTIISKAYREANPVTWGLRNDEDWMALGPVPEPGTLSLAPGRFHVVVPPAMRLPFHCFRKMNKGVLVI